MHKQVILVRQDLKLPKGKLAAQVSHASVSSVMRSDKKTVKEWESEGMKKVVLKVKDLDELLKFKEQAEDNKLIAALISDQGKTVLAPGTITCLGIGPDYEDQIDKITGKLKML